MSDSDLTENTNILEAVNNLSSIAELNIKKTSASADSKKIQAHRWFDAHNEIKTIGKVRSTLKTVHKYLKYIYAKESHEVNDPHVQKGIRSIVELAKEAASKIDHYYSLSGTRSMSESAELKELLEFYQKKILKKFKQNLEEEEKWQEELRKEEDAIDIQRRGLKDLETVIRDRDYELFYITKEDGSLFFNTNLLRHIRLVSDFDQIISAFQEEDPLLKLQIFNDHLIMQLAHHIKTYCKKSLDLWYKSAGKYREDPFIQTVFKALMGLFLAANPKNSILTTTTKTCSQYFFDFLGFYQLALSSMDYRTMIEEEVKEGFFQLTASLLHEIAKAIYLHKKDYRETVSYILQIIKFTEKDHKVLNALILFHMILDFHENLTAKLQQFPSGPLFKALDVFHSGGDSKVFDPFLLGDFPSYVFSIKEAMKTVRFLAGACPIRQTKIDEARIHEIFCAFLRSLDQEKIVMINLQDRTSWKDYARSHALEKFQQNAEFRKKIDVITLAINTPFYQQTEEYLELDSFTDFKNNFLDQILSEETCGYFFPKYISRTELKKKIQEIIEFICKTFYPKQKKLHRKERLDFIEMTHLFMTLYFTQELRADFVCIVGKDGFDLSSAFCAGLYATLHLLQDGDWKEEDYLFFLAQLFVPTLIGRERAIDSLRLSRTMSMLSTLSTLQEKGKSQHKKNLQKILGLSMSKDFSLMQKEVT